MFTNYFRIAWRNLAKSKGYSAINVIGLATGMSVALLISLWIYDEFSFDHYHNNHKRLGQIMSTVTFNGETATYGTTVVPLENELRTKYAGDFKRLSLLSNTTSILTVGDKKLSQAGNWAQPDFPTMLTLKMLHGSYAAFKDPSSIVLSASVATALFGNGDPLNQTVRVDNKTDFKVGGVYEDLPKNTSFYGINFLLPWFNKSNWWNTQSAEWWNHGCRLVVELNEHVDFDKTTAKIETKTQEHGFKSGNEHLVVQPLDKWHLYNEFKNGKQVGGDIQFVWLFAIIGIFVLLLACINFMNLSTARSEKRAREVGIRKTIGSRRKQLILQFLTESVLMSLLAMSFCIGIVLLSLPFFNQISDKDMSIPWGSTVFWLSSIGFSLVTGIIAGSYPAFYLSSFEPIKVLKGSFRLGKLASLPRKVLVVVQFTVSVTLIIGTIVVYRQVQYAKNRPIGYSSDGLIAVIMNTPDIFGHYNDLRKDLLGTGAVEDMSETNSALTEISSNNNGFDWAGKDPNTDPLFGTISVTHDFGKTIGWKIVEGRDFSRSFNDTGAFVVNRAAVKVAGLTNPVGKVMKWQKKDHVITGVIEDMVMDSPFNPAMPTIFQLGYQQVTRILVKLKPGIALKESIATVEPVFKKYNPASPFDFKFADLEYAKKFSEEEKIGNLSTVFAVLAIFISCLGLFGLASFVAEQRTKEIGVRKVLGASVPHLWRLLSKEFVMLVLVSCLLAIPIAWYFLSEWLLRYNYRISISWWIFAAAAIGALLITLLTVSFQAIRAAIANPVNTLRTQ